MRSLWIHPVPLAALAIVAAVGSPFADGDADRELTGLIAAFASGEGNEQVAAEAALLQLGPSAIPGLLALQRFAERVIGLRDALAAPIVEGQDTTDLMQRKHKAIEFFRLRGAVGLLLSENHTMYPWLEVPTARALVSLSPEVRDGHRSELVIALTDWLSRGFMPNGSQEASSAFYVRGQAVALLASLIGADLPAYEVMRYSGQDMIDLVLPRAREWLAAHPVGADAGTPTPAPADDMPEDRVLGLDELLSAYSSGDENQIAAAEGVLLRRGPDAVPNLRLLSATTQRILGMAAVLSGGIHDPGQTGAAASLTEVQEALAYFGGHGAAAYLVLGLASPDVQVNVLTARAIAGLDATTRRDHTSLLIAALVDALDRWPIVWGSEAATADYERREPLWRVLSDMLAMETERGAYGRIRAGQEEAIKTAARRWLAEHLEPLGEQ